MKLLVIGVNHKTAPIAMREKLAFSSDEVSIALDDLQKYFLQEQCHNHCQSEYQDHLQSHQNTDHVASGFAGCVIVSTCNRTELYIMQVSGASVASSNIHQQTEDMHNATQFPSNRLMDKMIHWLARFKGLDNQDISAYLYQYVDAHALTHWIRVASGLDSMILGEPQILVQIKQALNQAMQHKSFSNPLGWVVEQVFAAAKQVRHDTQVGAQAVTLGFATAKLATQIFDDLSKCTLLLVAAGEMNRLVSSHIVGLGIKRVIICNRSVERATALMQELKTINPNSEIEVKSLTELAQCLPQADIVSSCSGSMQTLIDFKMSKKAIKKRRYLPMLMVDLAVPRDIEEKVAKLDDVYLYSIDDLQHVIAGNLEQRRQAAVDAELMVSQLVVDIQRRYQVRQVGGDIQAFRNIAQTHADRLLADALLQVQHGHLPVEDIIIQLTRRLTKTLTHPPSTLLRQVASDGDSEVLDMVVQTLNDAYR